MAASRGWAREVASAALRAFRSRSGGRLTGRDDNLGRGGRSCTRLELEPEPGVGLVGEAEEALLEDVMGKVMEETWFVRGKRGELWISGLLADRSPLMVAESVSTTVANERDKKKTIKPQSSKPRRVFLYPNMHAVI